MTEKMRWKVLRRHDGDRLYEEGEVREGTKAELGHLAPSTLELIGSADKPKPAAEVAVKAEIEPANKSEPAPANKSEPAPGNKTDHQPRNKRK